MAASEFFRFGKYDLDLKSPDEPGGYIFPDQEEALKSSLRDWERLSKTAFEQDDWEAWMKFIAGAGIQALGDDLEEANG